MDLLKQCSLLALALLQVIVVAENLGCGSGGTGCRVIGGSDQSTVLECGNDNKESSWSKRVPKVLVTDIQSTNKTFQHVSNTFNNETKNPTHEDYSVNGSSGINRNNNFCETCSNVTLVNEDGHNVSDVSIKEKLTKIPINLNKSRNIIKNRHNENHWPLSTSLVIHLLGNLSVLDLSYFISVKTVIINTNGFTIFNVCGATNVSSLIVASSPSTGYSFVSFFNNLKYLNLSHSSVKAIPNNGIFTSSFSIDLSYNKIILNKNCSLSQNFQMLNISYNNISITEDVILKGNVIVLDIRGNKLSRVPVIDMNNLEELYISNNYITFLQEKTFVRLINLTILDLRANRLNHLEEKAFLGLNRLQWLDMSENNLMYFAPATFQYLINLVTLLLSKNMNLGNLQDIKGASLLFGTGQRLQKIEASGTNLSKIPSTVTRSVRKLYLADNTISTIQCGEVESFPLLQMIDISNNMIVDIEEDALGRLEFLSDLILGGNKLINIPKSLPNQLVFLDLTCNKITRLTNIDFLGLQKLRILLLSRNNISVVEDGAFGQLINLDVLELSFNPIKTLYRSSFTGPRRLKELYLTSLTDLIASEEPLSFPAPESSHLEVLYLDSSPELAKRLMDDVAALTMFHELYELSLRNCQQEFLRSDLPKYLPRLHKLDITRNPLNCTDVTWLIKWLQIMNITNNEAEKIKRCNYSNGLRFCEHIPDNKGLYNTYAICASPVNLAGKAIIYLKEENISNLRIYKTKPFPTEKMSSDEATEENKSKKSSIEDATSFTTPSVNGPVFTVSNSNELTIGYPMAYIELTTQTTVNNTSFNHPQLKKNKDIISEKSIHKIQNIWKYFNNKSKYDVSTSESFIVLINETKHTISVIDNQINDSVSSGAFLGNELPPTSHPGMMVFLFVIGVIIAASSAMVYTHYAQLRRSSQYHHQQDIEVSSFGGSELW